MKQLIFIVCTFLTALPSFALEIVDEHQIKQLAQSHSKDYCTRKNFTCHYAITPEEQDKSKDTVAWWVYVSRSVDSGGWPLFPPGDESLQLNYDKFGKLLLKRVITQADGRPFSEIFK
ncbi:hypothetical protein [Undibacterium sp. TC9W]|uniref:hypothetical protein n=1 Tax=Undibacterium sp. TC9W TaxID=3413053 RepID=UPI003BEF9F07